MSVKPMNTPDPETRPVLGPAGNKSRSAAEFRKPVAKTEKTQKPPEEGRGKKSPSPESDKTAASFRRRNGSSLSSSILRQRQPNLSMNASCSSDASTDSSQSRASTGRIGRRSVTPLRRKQPHCSPKEGSKKSVGEESVGFDVGVKKRCAWVTSNTDPSYAAFHDEEWGLPVHDDKKLFELLSYSTALAELTWPVILSKRHIFRDVFMDFDPLAVSKLNEKKIVTPGTPASTLLSEVKLRGIIENARQICKIIEELGSFDKYIWGFVNNKPIVGNFRYPRQVPIKTSKADTISKDLVRRGFRGVGPTVVYSFMQVSGITNDHLVSCFRYQDCITASNVNDNECLGSKNEGKQAEDLIKLELSRGVGDLSLSR